MIDNSLAERLFRPMTVERKPFIETCKMSGVSTLEYYKEFFKANMQGRTDYEYMLQMTIGINNHLSLI